MTAEEIEAAAAQPGVEPESVAGPEPRRETAEEAGLDPIASAELREAQDAERLSRHLDARLPATAAEAAIMHFASAHAARLLDRQDDGWRVGIQDAAGRDLGTIRLRIIPAGWQILALSPAS